MASKQDRITDAMKERITQLEAELCQCKHHLAETVQQKETLECDIDALQKEAHDVVAQWVAKSSELQTKLDESVSQVEVLRNDLLLSKKRNDDFQQRLQDAETKNSLQAEELHSLKEVQDDYAARLAKIEKDFYSALQQNTHYENLISKMDLEMKQVIEEMNSLIKEKDMLVEAGAELRGEIRRLEVSHSEVNSLVARLEDELASCQQLLLRLSDIMSFDEEERHARDEILFQWGMVYFHLLWDETRHHICGKSLLHKKHQELEDDMNRLRQEKSLLETELHKTSTELSSLRQDYDKTTSDLSQHVRLLEQDVAELQDSQISQKQIVEFLQKELENLTAQNEINMSLNDDLSTEFKAVKDCYSSLLLEYNELRVNEQRSQEEFNAKITSLTNENKIIRAEYDVCCQDLMTQNTNLHRRLALMERETLEHIEHEERLLVEVSESKEWTILFSDYSAQLMNWLHVSYGQLWTMRKEMDFNEASLKAKEDINFALSKKIDALKKEVSLKEDNITQLHSKEAELSSELKSSKATCEEIVNDNTWLKEQVETMRRELGELDELLNSNLNDMREESERQQLEHERLLQEIHRYKDLLQQSQEKINSLDERCLILATDNEAISKTLLLTEGELSNAKKEIAVVQRREKVLVEQKREIELDFMQLQKKHVTADSQTALLQEQLQTQEAKLQLLSKSSRQEMETIKMKLNSFIEKYEEAETRVSVLSKSVQESETIQSNLREAYQRAKAALEEAKQRCCKDTDTIQKLLEERQSLEDERESIVEKYNRVHDMLKALKKDSMGKFSDEIQKLSDLCSQQEVELQQLRHQNIMLKKGIKKLPITANSDGQIERPVFVERLNLTEGPLRRPKKRPVMNEDARVIMEVRNRDYDPCVKVSLELESLLQHHFQQRQHSKRILKDRLRKAELEIAHLQQSVTAYSQELEAERSKFEALQRTMEDAKRQHAAELMAQDRLIRDRISDIDARARLLVAKTEECEGQLQSLQKREEELLNREKELKFYQASFEAGIIPAQRQIEAERVRMHYAREKADQLLNEAKKHALATEDRRHNLEMFYTFKMQCFGLEKEETARRMYIMQQEMLGIMCLISSRRTHVSVVEAKAAERIRILEHEFASKKEVYELKEREVYLRHQREEQRLRDEKERIMSIRETMRQDYRLVLEGIRLFGNERSTETEELQIDALKDLEKLLFSALDDQHLKLEKKP